MKRHQKFNKKNGKQPIQKKRKFSHKTNLRANLHYNLQDTQEWIEHEPFCFSPKGTYLAFVFRANVVVLLNVKTGKRKKLEIKNYNGNIMNIFFTPNENALYVNYANDPNEDGKTLLWDLKNSTYKKISGESCIDASPCRKCLAISTLDDNKLHLLNLETKQYISIQCKSSIITTFSKGGEYCILEPDTINEYTPPSLYKIKDFKKLIRIQLDCLNNAHRFTFSPCGTYLAIAGKSKSFVININTMKIPYTLQSSFQFPSFIFSQDGKHLAYHGFTGKLELCNLELSKYQIINTSPDSKQGSLRSIVFSPCGKYFASSSDTGLRIWNVKNGKYLQTLTLDKDVHQVLFHPSGRYIASRSPKTVKVWKLSGPSITKSPFNKKDFKKYDSISDCSTFF